MFWVRNLLLIFYARYFYAISEEYYNDYYNNTETTVVNISDARRTANSKDQGKIGIVLPHHFSSESDSSEEAEGSFSDDEFKIYVVGKKSAKLTRNKSKLSPSNPHISTTTLPPSNTSIRRIVSTFLPTIHFFKDYEYVYDDNVSTTPKQEVTTERKDILKLSPSNDDVNVSSVFLTDFYNIEPAAIVPDMNLSYRSLTSNRVWYVPERYPCWKLPVLYGELGQRKNTSDVFTIYGGTLKNVLDLEKRKPKWDRDFVINPAKNQMHNKWCGVEPCYGDHTLCLFPSNNIISKICDSKYTVQIPSMVEQIALINTVNSMRNRIAKGICEEYSHLPPAANMNQMIYDLDLEKISAAWLRQCLPGPAPCSALDGNLVTQLECTKTSERCCLDTYKTNSMNKCIPKEECFVSALIGCIYAWFLSAGVKLQATDVYCGFTTSSTYSTAQIIWAETKKIGCAFGERNNGDIRVVCNFSPGAPFFLSTKYYCGVIAHQDITKRVIEKNTTDVTDLIFLRSLGINLHSVHHKVDSDTEARYNLNHSKLQLHKRNWYMNALTNLYKQAFLKKGLNDQSNVTKGYIVSLVTKYTFFEETESKCDSGEPMYIIGESGSLCLDKGKRFDALCYDFGDPTPGYRLVAVIAPVALFSLILYDLFSGVVRQTNY